MCCSCLSSHHLIWSGFMPVHITGLIKQQRSRTSARSGSLLIIHSAGGQMALGSHSFTTELINQFLEQLWVIVCALNLTVGFYEVQFCVNRASELSHCSNCACFHEWWPSCDLNTLLYASSCFASDCGEGSMWCKSKTWHFSQRGSTSSGALLSLIKNIFTTNIEQSMID